MMSTKAVDVMNSSRIVFRFGDVLNSIKQRCLGKKRNAVDRPKLITCCYEVFIQTLPVTTSSHDFYIIFSTQDHI